MKANCRIDDRELIDIVVSVSVKMVDFKSRDSFTYDEWMDEIAEETKVWLKHFGHLVPPPPFEDRFSLD